MKTYLLVFVLYVWATPASHAQTIIDNAIDFNAPLPAHVLVTHKGDVLIGNVRISKTTA
ncbi:MAG: hypothetical protein R2795_23520 [Saprospiraceae bacterium]